MARTGHSITFGGMCFGKRLSVPISSVGGGPAENVHAPNVGAAGALKTRATTGLLCPVVETGVTGRATPGWPLHGSRGAAGQYYRAFDTTAEYRDWCERSLPGWLGYGQSTTRHRVSRRRLTALLPVRSARRAREHRAVRVGIPAESVRPAFPVHADAGPVTPWIAEASIEFQLA